jgi:CheY-like chemotaxis protein
MATILFIDDEPLTLKLLSQAARILGHQSLTASGVAQAFSLVEAHRPDLVFTDINLGVERSLDFIDRMHQSPDTRQIPVITLSASETAEVEAAARSRGAVASLSKPIRLQTLLEVIREYTQSPN